MRWSAKRVVNVRGESVGLALADVPYCRPKSPPLKDELSRRKRIPNPIDVRRDIHAVRVSLGQHDRRANASREAYPISKTLIDGKVVVAQNFLGELPTAPSYQICKVPRGISQHRIRPIEDADQLGGVRLNEKILATKIKNFT